MAAEEEDLAAANALSASQVAYQEFYGGIQPGQLSAPATTSVDEASAASMSPLLTSVASRTRSRRNGPVPDLDLDSQAAKRPRTVGGKPKAKRHC